PRRAVQYVASTRYAVAEGVLVVAGYTALAVATTWPLAAHLGGALPGTFPNDAAGGAAWLEQLHKEDGFHLLGFSHHTLTAAPFGWNQGNALNFQWLLPFYPAYLVAGWFGGLVAVNLVTLSGLVLSAAAMYLLVRWLGCGALIAAWSGLVY